MFGTGWITVPVLGLAAWGLAQRHPRRSVASSHTASRDAGSPAGAGLVLGAYVVGYLVVHTALTFQPWDRYLLPVLPLICVLAGAGAPRRAGGSWSAGFARGRRATLARAAAAATVAGVGLYAASLGVGMSIPVGSDVGAYRGVAEAARFLAAQPGRPTVYHDHLGWHLDYYLYGLPVTRSWFDSPQKLASEAARVAAESPGSTQWLALPAWEDSDLARLASALAARGFEADPAVEIVAAAGGKVDLTLYRLVPARATDKVAAAPGQGSRP